MIQKFRTLVDRFEHPAGTVCYECQKHDYGCARDDTLATGEYHVSVTTDPTGDYPFFTIADKDLWIIYDQANGS
jgi:hypothetical protein